jgi:hypothetical protein
MSKQSNDDQAVQSITDAQEGHTDEMRRRMVKYTVAMSIRLACLLLFFFVDGWLRWMFIAGAVFLPWIAVVIANSGSDQSNLQHSDSLLDHAPVAELEASPATRAEPTDVLAGEVIDDGADRDGDATGGTDAPSRPGTGDNERLMDQRGEDGDAA